VPASCGCFLIRAVVFLFFAIVLNPCRSIIAHQNLLPGLFTALFLYVPLFALLITLAHEEG